MYPKMKKINGIHSEEEFERYVKEQSRDGSYVDWAIGTQRSRKYLELLCRLKYEILETRVLDIGSGFGGLSLYFSGKARTVVAMDTNKELLHVAHKRARNVDRGNLFTLAGSGTDIPLRDAYMDLVLMIGVLEWAPYSKPSNNPEQTQREVLREVRQKLKRNGMLILAIENRYYLGYWLGIKDPHSQLPLLPILPRFAADSICRMMKGERYFFNRTYSYFELKKILTEEGFIIQDTFVGLPSYSVPQEIADMNNRNEIAEKRDSVRQVAWKRTIWKFIDKAGLTTFLGDNQIWICRRPNIQVDRRLAR